MSGSHEKNPGRVISGLKATIHNPNVSEQAKERARERLTNLGVQVGTPQPAARSAVTGFSEEDEDPIAEDRKTEYAHDKKGPIAGEDIGDDSDPDFSPGATLDAELDNLDDLEDFDEELTKQSAKGAPKSAAEGRDHRVLGGYKATMHNPRVSQKAKDNARHILEENDAL